MGVNRLTGSPWHKEKIHRAQGDERRYKGRCKFYRYEKPIAARNGWADVWAVYTATIIRQ